MRWAQRDGALNVIGHYANPQSYAQEALADDHPDILAFTAAKTPPPPTLKQLFKCLTADAAAGNVNTAQPWFPSQGAVTVDALSTYILEGWLHLANGVVTHTTGVLFGGTATLNSIDYYAMLQSGALNALTTTQSSKVCSVASNQVLNATSTGASTHIWIKGIIRINAGGTLIPQFQFSAAPGGTNLVKRNTHFQLTRIGDNLITSDGTWT